MPYNHEAVKLAYQATALDAVHVWAAVVLGEAQAQTPFETGALRASGTITEHAGPAPGGIRGSQLPPSAGQLTPAPLGGTYAELRISFVKVYAAYQHEGHRRDGTHVIRHHPLGGKTHYLEDPFKGNIPLLPLMIESAERKLLR